MRDDQIILPYLDEKGLDGKKICNNRQWLDRFKQNTKRKYEIDIGPLIKKETMTGTDEWNTKEEKMQQDFLWALGPEATHQKTKPEYRTDPDNIKIDNLKKPYNKFYLPKWKKTQEEIFLGKTNRYGHTRRTLGGEFTRFRKRMQISGIQHQITYIKIHNINHRQRTKEQTVERRRLRFSESSRTNTTKHIRPKEQKEHPTGSSDIKSEKYIKEEPTHKITYTGQNSTRSK